MRLLRIAVTSAIVAAVPIGVGAQGSVTGDSRVVVSMEAVRFAPEVLRVRLGDTVVWVNDDPFPHTATADDRSFDSGIVASGDSWSLTATRAGTFPYVCALHPTMTGTLIVE
jgi:plastocyanin